MDFLEIMKNFGFPIACVIALFIMLQNEQKAHREESEKMSATITELKVSFSDAIREQEKTVTTAINNNTLVMQKLIDKLGGDGNK